MGKKEIGCRKMDIDTESEIIIKAINETIKELEKEPHYFPKEEDIQLRLYVHLCNMFHKKQEGSFWRIKIEKSPYTKEQMKYNKEYASQVKIEKSHLEHIFKKYKMK